MKKNLYLISLLLYVFGCNYTQDSTTSIDSQLNHPNINNLNINVDDNAFFSIVDTSIVNKLNLTNTFGASFGESNETFGYISSVLTDQNDKTYIFDLFRQHIKVYDPGGELLTTLGGRGNGPGEFNQARSMAIFNNKWLLVGNSYRIEIFNIGTKIPVYLNTIRIDKNIKSLCVTSKKLFIHNVQQVNSDGNEDFSIPIIHLYSLPHFEYISSFGESYKSKNPMVIENLSIGNVICSDDLDTLLFTYERIPLLINYSLSSHKIEWALYFKDSNFSRLIELQIDGRNAVQHKINGNFVDRFSHFSNYDNDQFVIQFQRAIFDEDKKHLGAEEFKTISYLVNKKSGNGYLIKNEIPQIIYISNQ